MLKLKSIKENIIAFVVALILALIVLVVINSSELLKADILTSDAEEQVVGNLVYGFDQGTIALNANQSFEGVSTLSIVILFDENTYKGDMNSFEQILETPYEYGMAKAGEGKYNVIFSDIGQINKGDNILNILSVKEDVQMEISEASVTYTDGTNEELSISKKK